MESPDIGYSPPFFFIAAILVGFILVKYFFFSFFFLPDPFIKSLEVSVLVWGFDLFPRSCGFSSLDSDASCCSFFSPALRLLCGLPIKYFSLLFHFGVESFFPGIQTPLSHFGRFPDPPPRSIRRLAHCDFSPLLRCACWISPTMLGCSFSSW